MGPTLAIYVEALRNALPCTSREEIHRGMARILRTRTLPKSAVSYALGYVRRNAEELGWTVPQANSAPASAVGTEGRFFVLPAERTPDMGTLNEEQRDHIDTGSMTTITNAESRLTNLATILEMALQHENLRVHREYLRDAAEMVQTAARRLTRVRNVVNEKMSEAA
jgi:hypothetical protein